MKIKIIYYQFLIFNIRIIKNKNINFLIKYKYIKR